MASKDPKCTAVDRCLAELFAKRGAISGLTSIAARADEVTKIAGKHSLELERGECGMLWGYLQHESLLRDAETLLKDARFRSSAPIDIIFDNAAEIKLTAAVEYWSVFICGSDESKLTSRHVRVNNILNNSLVKRVTAHLEAFLSDKTMVIGGPSGSGKTVALLASSKRGNRTVAAYMREYNTTKAIHNDTLSDVPNQRDAAVLAFLVEEITELVPEAAKKAMGQLGSERLNFVVAMDELGPRCFSKAVRALCALTGDTLKAKLAVAWNVDLSSVTFFIAIAGTGIGYASNGGGDDEKEEASFLCSENRSHSYIYPLGSSLDGADDASNMDIFCSYFEGFTPDRREAFEASAHSLFLQFASGNARIAAILGNRIYRSVNASMAQNNYYGYPTVLSTIDLSLFLFEAIFEFKQKNALEKVPFLDLWEHLVRAVRLHYFPLARHTSAGTNAHDYEARFGLVHYIGGHCADVAGAKASPVELSPFAVALLSVMMGNEPITRSMTCGDSLEAYVLGTFFLIAAAAGEPTRFASALAMGEMGPVTVDGSDPRSQDEDCSPNGVLRTAIHDITADPRPLLAEEEEGRCVRSRYRIVDEVKRILDASFNDSNSAKNNVFVAAFRSPDKAQFADVFIFIGNRLFLFQCEDAADVSDAMAGLALWKMGSQSEDAYQAFVKKYGDAQGQLSAELAAKYMIPQDIAARLIAAYHKVTGVRVEQVLPYIVTPFPLKTKKKAGAATISIDAPADVFPVPCGNERWSVSLMPAQRVSVASIEFLRFDPKRGRAKPCAFSRLTDLPLNKFSAPPASMPSSSSVAVKATKKSLSGSKPAKPSRRACVMAQPQPEDDEPAVKMHRVECKRK